VTSPDARLAALCELGSRIAGAQSLEEVVDATMSGLDELLGHRHSLLLLHHVETDRLVTLASCGYEADGIGSEVVLGDGVIGLAGLRRAPMRIGNLQRMLAYARTVQRMAARDGRAVGAEVDLPGLPGARSQLAAPLLARGALIGVVAVESEAALAFDEVDEHIITVLGLLVGAALDREQLATTDAEVVTVTAPPTSPPAPSGQDGIRLRHYAVDGSTFLDGSYLIKGVAGRLLWKVAQEYVASGRTAFTNREARLDPALELPPFRDNFESRLILLKRRLDERGGPLRVKGAGRGCFELRVDAPLTLERVDPA
jgi:adenylate cyclase